MTNYPESREVNPRQKTLVIGYGEIGRSLANVFSKVYAVDSIDKVAGTPISEHYEIIHICYPYSEKFIEITKEYIKRFTPSLTIIHSTVPPGTTEQLGFGVVHSPVNGKHPNLEQGIETFVKFIGPNDAYAGYRAVKFFENVGIKAQVVSNARTSELAKILCTTYYGWNIVFMKEVVELCKSLGVPFHEVYTRWNNEYNAGYQRLGDEKYRRPVLAPLDGPIGGHCVVNNCELLDCLMTNIIKEANVAYEGMGEMKPETSNTGENHGKGRRKN